MKLAYDILQLTSFKTTTLYQSTGNNRLMRLIHEVDSPNYESITELDPMCPALWRYRKKITLEYVSFKFQEYSQGRDKADRCEVLAEFLKKVCRQIRSYSERR